MTTESSGNASPPHPGPLSTPIICPIASWNGRSSRTIPRRSTATSQDYVLPPEVKEWLFDRPDSLVSQYLGEP